MQFRQTTQQERLVSQVRFILTIIAVMFALDGICWALLACLANSTA